LEEESDMEVRLAHLSLEEVTELATELDTEEELD